MYQPPPLRSPSVFDDKRFLLIDPHQRAREVRASVLRSHGIQVQTAEDLCRARALWRPHAYDLILVDARGHLPGEAFDFYREIKHAGPRERVVFLVGPPTYVSLTWPTEFMARETEPQHMVGDSQALVQRRLKSLLCDERSPKYGEALEGNHERPVSGSESKREGY